MNAPRCPSCGYSLVGLLPAHPAHAHPAHANAEHDDSLLRCPECGNDVTLSELQRASPPPSMKRELTRVLLAPVLILGLLIVLWASGDMLILLGAAPGGVIASIVMAIVHAVERPSGLSRTNRRRLIAAGLIAHAVMLGTSLLISWMAMEFIASC